MNVLTFFPNLLALEIKLFLDFHYDKQLCNKYYLAKSLHAHLKLYS